MSPLESSLLLQARPPVFLFCLLKGVFLHDASERAEVVDFTPGEQRFYLGFLILWFATEM